MPSSLSNVLVFTVVSLVVFVPAKARWTESNKSVNHDESCDLIDENDPSFSKPRQSRAAVDPLRSSIAAEPPSCDCDDSFEGETRLVLFYHPQPETFPFYLQKDILETSLKTGCKTANAMLQKLDAASSSNKTRRLCLEASQHISGSVGPRADLRYSTFYYTYKKKLKIGLLLAFLSDGFSGVLNYFDYVTMSNAQLAEQYTTFLEKAKPSEKIACRNCYQYAGDNRFKTWTLIKIMQYFGWKKAVFILSCEETENIGLSPIYSTMTRCQNLASSLNYENKEYTFLITQTQGRIKKYLLESISTTYSIIFVCGFSGYVHKVLKVAEQEGLMDKGEYVFIDVFASAYTAHSKMEYGKMSEKIKNQVLVLTMHPSEFNLERNQSFIQICWYDMINFYAANWKNNGLINSSKPYRYKGLNSDFTILPNGECTPQYALYGYNEENWKRSMVFSFYYDESKDFDSSIAVEPSISEKDDKFLFSSYDYAVPPDVPYCAYNNKKHLLICLMWPKILIALGLTIFLIAILLISFRHSLKEYTWIYKRSELIINSQAEFSEEQTNVSENIINSEFMRNSNIMIGTLNGQIVAIKERRNIRQLIKAMNMKEIAVVKRLDDNIITPFVGAVVNCNPGLVLTDFSYRGSLHDLLCYSDKNLSNNWKVKLSLCFDLAKAMSYLHHDAKLVHGKMRSTNCLVDKYFVVKLSNFLPRKLQPTWYDPMFELGFQEPNVEKKCNIFKRKKNNNTLLLTLNEDIAKKLLWTAPELLREWETGIKHNFGTFEGDIYSLGIIFHEIMEQKGPFSTHINWSNQEIIKKVVEAPISVEEPFRPDFSKEDEEPRGQLLMIEMISLCWHENSKSRLSAKVIKQKVINLMGSENIKKSTMLMLDKHSSVLQLQIQERTKEYLDEKLRVQNLVFKMLPEQIALQLTRGECPVPRLYTSVTMLCSDIVNFTPLASSLLPMEVVQMLNEIFQNYDKLMIEYKVLKYETIGDAYIVVSGVPEERADHAERVADFGVAMRNSLWHYEYRCHGQSRKIEIRIGIHSGGVVAGVLGTRHPKYTIFGKNYEITKLMESHGSPMKVHVTEETRVLLVNNQKYSFEKRGTILLEHPQFGGRRDSYFLEHSQSHQ